jgi:HEAT repeat protein
MDIDEELFKGWPVCAGWLTEVCTYGMDLMIGTSSYISEKTDKFRMEPICNQHTGEPGNHYVSEQFWIALVEMFGFVTEDEGEVSYDPKSVKPDMISWDRMLNNETENSLNQTRIIMAYISGHNHFTWNYPMPNEKSLSIIVEEIKKLTKALKDNDEDVRIEAANHLGYCGDERAIEPLIEALKNNSFYKFVRSEAARALGILSNELGDKRAVVPLIEALKDDDRSVRSSAASALEYIGDERAVEPLIEALKDNDEDVRIEAASSLGKIGDERAVEPLIKALKDDGEYVASSAARALGEIGDERAVEPLIEALKDDDPSVRRWAAWSLGEIADNRCIEPLIKVLKDDDQDVRKWTIRALGKINDIRAVEHLIEALKDDDEDLRKIAAKALGEIGDERAIEPLIDALMKIKGKNQ